MPVLKFRDPADGTFKPILGGGGSLTVDDADTRYTQLVVPDPVAASDAANKAYVDATDVVPHANFSSSNTNTSVPANAWVKVNPGTIELTGGITWNETHLGFVLPKVGLYAVTMRSMLVASVASRLDMGITLSGVLNVQLSSHYVATSTYAPNASWVFSGAAGNVVGMAQRCNTAVTTNYNTMHITRLGAQ